MQEASWPSCSSTIAHCPFDWSVEDHPPFQYKGVIKPDLKDNFILETTEIYWCFAVLKHFLCCAKTQLGNASCSNYIFLSNFSNERVLLLKGLSMGFSVLIRCANAADTRLQTNKEQQSCSTVLALTQFCHCGDWEIAFPSFREDIDDYFVSASASFLSLCK